MRTLHGTLALIGTSLLAGCGSSDATGSGGAAGSGGSAGSSGAAGSSGSGGSAGAANVDDYLDRPLREQVTALEATIIDSDALTAAYLGRISQRDTGPNGVHALLALDATAATQATAADGARGGGKLLQGATILIKDNIDTAGLATTAGSLALASNVPAADAPLVARIRAANGVVLGKTNLSEWANFRGNRAASGWSAVGGQTRNGRNPDYNPCGSSSGSGAGIAAGLASGAIGTETDGSIICPASMNGVVGFKPTVGLVSRAGIVPISHTQDTAGPLARTVGDAARILSVIAGADPSDPATSAIPANMKLDFEAPLATATLSGKRLGALRLNADADLGALFDAERARIEAAGATVVDVTMNAYGFGAQESVVLLHEFKVDIESYLAAHARAGQATTLQALIDFNEAHTAEEMPYFGQELFYDAQATTGLNAPEYLTAKAAAFAGAATNGIDALLAANQLDAIIAPSMSPAFQTDYVLGDRVTLSATAPAAIAGYPHLSVPMGDVYGLPVGLSFFSTAWKDAEVLALGYAYEQLPR